MVLLGTSATLTAFEMREPVYIGVDTPYIQLAFDNWAISSTGADLLPPTDLTITEVAIEKASATSPVLFSGSRSTVIAPGETKFSDRLYASDFGLSRFSRGDLIWVRKRGTVPINGQMFDGVQVAAFSANGCYATRFDPTAGSNNVSQVDATGAMSAKTGQADFGAGINTTCVIGLPLDPRIPSVYAQGTSIDQSSIDADITTLLGGGGWIMRAMFDAGNTKPIPVLNHARASSSLAGGIAGLTRRSAYYRYCTVAIDGHATGDIQQTGAGDITVFRANELTQWAAFRAGGIGKIIKPKVIPRNQSSDLWATLANQSQTAAFDTKAQDVNDWIDAQLAGGLIDYVLSQNVTRYDTGTNAWKWPVDGSAKWSCEDGTHPVARMHALMGADLRTLLGQIYPYAV